MPPPIRPRLRAASEASSSKGNYYVVSTAGATSLDGNSVWNPGDATISDGSAWEKIDGVASEVLSFNGRTGTVTPQSGDYTPSLVGLGNVTNNLQLVAANNLSDCPMRGRRGRISAWAPRPRRPRRHSTRPDPRPRRRATPRRPAAKRRTTYRTWRAPRRPRRTWGSARATRRRSRARRSTAPSRPNILSATGRRQQPSSTTRAAPLPVSVTGTDASMQVTLNVSSGGTTDAPVHGHVRQRIHHGADSDVLPGK